MFQFIEQNTNYSTQYKRYGVSKCIKVTLLLKDTGPHSLFRLDLVFGVDI